MASSDKLERLLNLTAALVDAESPLPAREIQRRVAGYSDNHEAFLRTFSRDKNDLKALGVPLRVVKVPGTDPPEDGYWVDRSLYEMPSLQLDDDELMAIKLALQVVAVGDPDETVAGALRRLGGLPFLSDDDDQVDADMIGAEFSVDPSLPAVFAAITQKQIIEFDYETAGESSSRRVEPWFVDFRRGHWYLTGFDSNRNDVRHFRLDRIVSDVSAAEGTFSREPEAQTQRQPWEADEGPAMVVSLRIDERQAEWAEATLGRESVVEQRPDGSVLFQVSVTSWPAFRSFVLSFLDAAEIEGPPEARAQMIEWLTAVSGVGNES
ncbi:MAG: hypothetical protein RLZZ31_102 [Actinomycetota bacterium]